MDIVALWGLFAGLVLGTLFVDLLVFSKKPHVMPLREASVWCGIWVSLAAAFGAAVFFLEGSAKGLEFVTGYVIEWSLSVDNLFVFIVIFRYFAVPPAFLHRVLFYGIMGAVVLRGIFIAAGVGLLTYFHWTIYIFGAFLVYTGVKLLRAGEVEVEPQKNPVLRFFTRFMPIETTYDEQKFFVRRNGKLVGTALVPVLIVIETTDVMFAVDSVPAILAITRDPFIVYTSNIFAILGLRALFFLLAGVMGTVPVPQDRALLRPLVRGSQDADLRLLQDPDHGVAGRSWQASWRPRSWHPSFSLPPPIPRRNGTPMGRRHRRAGRRVRTPMEKDIEHRAA